MNSAIQTDLESDPAADISKLGNGEIAALAYQLWKDRGCPIGSPDEDWLLAEAELTNQQRRSAVAA